MSRLRALKAKLLAGRLGRMFRPNPLRLPLWLVLIGTLLFGGISWAQQTPAPVLPEADATKATITYRQSWTLTEIAAHIESGEVVAITATSRAPKLLDPIPIESQLPAAAVGGGATTDPSAFIVPGGMGPVMVATLKDGQQVPVDLVIPYTTAFDVLRINGYSRLLSIEAIAARANPVTFMRGEATTVIAEATRPWWQSFGTVVGLTLLMGGFLLLVVRLQTGGGAGRSGAFSTILPGKKRSTVGGGAGDGEGGETELPRGLVKLADVAGCEEAKLELTETVEFLLSPERFAKLGAVVPRGVLFHGPPGNGKTLLARAVAGEAGVPFTYASGSDFVEMYVGVGAARIRKLFEEAKKHGKGVIFIDEIDAMAKKRGGAQSNDERENTLNALLVEMDGFATNENIVVIGATNRLDTIDSAALRPGRFTRKVHVPMPDRDARREILGVHAKSKPIAKTVDLDALARKTAGFSGAQIADLLNEAAIIAARASRKKIEPEDIRGGWLKSAVGTSRRRSMDERERSIIAAHEAGHAICGRVHGESRRVEEISLYQHGEAIGVTVSSGEDNSLPAADDLRAQLVALMGGRAAEELCFREITGGASNDFEKATEIARHMVRVWGIGADPRNPVMTGVAIVGSDEGASLDLRESRERAERSIIEAALVDARRTLISHREQLDRVSAYLFEHERIDGDEFSRVFEGTLLPTSTDLGAWRVAGSHPRDWSEIDQIAIDISQPAIEPVAFPTPPPLDTEGRSSYVGVPIEVAKTLALLPLDLLKTLADLPVEMLKDAIERGRRGGKGPGLGA